jgi:L-lactate dehydrogenase complex protein LldG
MSARDRILGRLGAAAPKAGLPMPWLGLPDATPLSGASLGERLPVFRAALDAAHAEFIDARGDADWVALINIFCKANGVRRLLLPTGLKGFTAEHGLSAEVFDRPIESIKEALFKEIDAGLTVADCGLADTGMLVLKSSPQQARTLSLVPPVHFCLINVNRLYADMPGALAGERWGAGMPSNLIFVSGPSKTADIQQTLAYGAHGPKRLIVVLVEKDLLS